MATESTKIEIGGRNREKEIGCQGTKIGCRNREKEIGCPGSRTGNEEKTPVGDGKVAIRKRETE